MLTLRDITYHYTAYIALNQILCINNVTIFEIAFFFHVFLFFQEKKEKRGKKTIKK